MRIIPCTTAEEALEVVPDNEDDQGPSGAVIDPPAGPSGKRDVSSPEPLEPSPGPLSVPKTPALQTGFAGLRKGFLLKKDSC